MNARLVLAALFFGAFFLAFCLILALWPTHDKPEPSRVVSQHAVNIAGASTFYDSLTTTTSMPTTTTGMPTTEVARSAPKRTEQNKRPRETRVQATGLPAVLWAIARCEGYPGYVNRDHGPESTASGKFGFLDSTWRSWRGQAGAQYARAMHAPEWVQDEAAVRLWRSAGTKPWNASRSCWGGAA